MFDFSIWLANKDNWWLNRDRDVHDIYDVILKIIISVYGTLFLNYIGIEDEIKEILNVEFTTLTGKKGIWIF